MNITFISTGNVDNKSAKNSKNSQFTIHIFYTKLLLLTFQKNPLLLLGGEVV